MKRLRLALALTATLAGGVALGRATAPVRTTAQIATVEDERLTVLRFASTHTWSTSWSTKTRDRIVTRWLPSGAVEREEDRASEASGTTQGTISIEGERRDEERHQLQLTLPAPAPQPAPPRLFVGALAQPTELTAGIDVVAGVRLAGPVWILGGVELTRGQGPTWRVGVGATW